MENIYQELEKRKKPDGTWDLPAVIEGKCTFAGFFEYLAPMNTTIDDAPHSIPSELGSIVLKNPKLFEDHVLSAVRIESVFSIPDTGRWTDYPILSGITGKLSGMVYLYPNHCDFELYGELDGLLIKPAAKMALRLCNHVVGMDPRSTAELVLTLNLDGLDTPIEFTTPLFERHDYWWLNTHFTDGLGAFDIANFFGKLFGADTLLLPPNSPMNNFKLYELTFGMDYQTELYMQYIRAYLATAEPWKLPLNFLTIDYLYLMWEMQWGKDKGGGRPYLFTGKILASLTLSLPNDFKLTLSGAAQIPEMIIEAHLRLNQDNPRTVGELMGSAANSLPGTGASGITLAALDLLANPEARELSLYAELQTGRVLSFMLGGLTIALGRLYAGADFRQTGNVYYLGGEIDFGVGNTGFTLALKGTYTSPKTGESYWTFQGGLSRGVVSLGALIRQMLKIEPGSGKQFDIVLSEFDISYETRTKNFSLTAAFKAQWEKIYGELDVAAMGKIRLHSDQNGVNKLAVLLNLEIKPFEVSVQIDDLTGTPDYNFRFAFREHALKATYRNRVLTAQFENVSLGDIIAFLIELVAPNHVVRFPPPWDFLNKIDLSKFSFKYDFNAKSLSVDYGIELNVIGLFTVHSIGVTYHTEESKVMFRIDTSAKKTPYEWDLLESNSPGMVNTQNKFKLHYLAVAQHFSDAAGLLPRMNTIIDAVKYLADKKTKLAYSDSANWLFAADFTINDVFRARALLLDPHLYGIAITIDGKKEPFSSFDGLMLELLYKKISRSVGMFKATLVLPQKYRRFSVGYATVTIGRMSIEIYTNGDFKIDLGFPHNRDFSQSFALEFGIFSGSGGFYFGLLSGATYPDLPAVSGGYYAPVITLGIGLSIGIGRSFDIGIVSAGFSLQAVGIFEGVMAFYNEETRPGNTYLKAKAVLGLTGRVYVKVDLCIVKLSASIEFRAFVQVLMETGKPVLIDLDLELTLQATVTILFFDVDFEYHLSFHKQIVIETNKKRTMLPANRLCRYTADAKTTVSLDVLPYFSLREASGSKHEHVLAFLPVMGKGDFRKLVTLLVDWVKKSPESGDADYKTIRDFLADNVEIHLQIRTRSDTGGKVDGVVFAMPPPLELWAGEVRREYWLDNPITNTYTQKLQSYFNTFDLDDEPQTFAALENDQTPIAEMIFTDYFNMLLRHITKTIKQDQNSAVNSDELAAMVSRFMLQGLRLPEEYGDGTRAFYEAIGQQIPFAHDGRELTLKVCCGQTGVTWLKGSSETTFSSEQINELLPNTNFSWTNKFNIKPMERFMSAPKLCSVSEQLKIGGRVLYRFGGDISGFSSPVLKLDGTQTVVECDFGALLSVEIRQTGHADVFSVIGLGPTDRAKLIPLFQAGNKDYKLLYAPAPMDGKKDTFIDLLAGKNDRLIRQNLTRETRMFTAKSRRVGDANDAQVYVSDLESAHFLRLLWQCSVVCGGYYLYLKPDKAPRVPRNLFDDEGTAKLWLYVKTGDTTLANCALSRTDAQLEETATLHDAVQSDVRPTLAPGCFGAEISFDSADTGDGLNIFSYSLTGEKTQSRPLIPVQNGSGTGLHYAPVWALHKLSDSQNPYDAKTKRFSFRLRDVLGNFTVGEKTYTATPDVSDFVIGAHEWPCTKLTWEPNGSSSIKVTLSCTGLDTPANTDSIDTVRRALYQAAEVTSGIADTRCIFPSCTVYLNQLLTYIQNPVSSALPRDVSISFSQSLKTPLQPIGFALTMERGKASDIERAKRAVILITPNITDDLKTFAEKFEAAFSGHKLTRTGSEPEQLVAVSVGDGSGLSLAVSPYDRSGLRIPVYYAFRPLCNRAITRECAVTPWGGKDSELRVFADIDMEVWAKHILEDVDHVLSPAFAAGLAPCAEMSDLIAIKEQFAQNIAKQLVPIEQNAPDALVKTVQEWMLEHLRVSLAGAYETSSVAQYRSKLTLPGSRARLTLNAKGNGEVTAFFGKADTDSNILCVGYRFASRYHTGFVPDFHVNAEHLELGIADIDDGYQTSAWLQMIHPFTCPDVSLVSDLPVPNPLRAVPEKSELVMHAFSPGKKIYEWDYCMRVKTTAAEQDLLSVEVEFGNNALKRALNADDLFNAMARYETVRLELLAALAENPAGHIAAFNAHAEAIAMRWGTQAAVKKTANVTNVLKFDVSMELDKTIKLNLSGYDTSEWTLEAKPVTQEILPGELFEFDIIVKSLPLYTQNVARPKLICTRNSKILGALTVHSDFVYKTEEVSLPALCAFSEGGNLACGTVGKLSESEVMQAQKRVSQELGFAGASGCLADIVVRYQYGFGESVIRLPACMFIDVDIGAFANNANVAREFMAWHQKVDPITDGAALEFEFKVSTGERALARFGRVSVRVV